MCACLCEYIALAPDSDLVTSMVPLLWYLRHQ